MGELDNTIVAFTTDNGAEVITYPDGGVTPFKGGKLTTVGRRHARPMVVRWPGHIKPGTVMNEMFSALDWLPTLVDIGGGPKGNDAERADRWQASIRASSRRRSTVFNQTRLTWKASRARIGAGRLLLLHGPEAVGGSVQELEVLLHDGAEPVRPVA